jgi:hypothetical protein
VNTTYLISSQLSLRAVLLDLLKSTGAINSVSVKSWYTMFRRLSPFYHQGLLWWVLCSHCVIYIKDACVLLTILVHIATRTYQSLLTEMETSSEISGTTSVLTQISSEDFIACSRSESFKSYKFYFRMRQQVWKWLSSFACCCLCQYTSNNNCVFPSN